MHSTSIVVAQADCTIAEHLAATLHSYFRGVSVARDVEELQHAIARFRASLAIVDLDLVSQEQLSNLAANFPETRIVCTHRVPDEDMWRQCLEAGATDCCPTSDIDAILHATLSRRTVTYAARAA